MRFSFCRFSSRLMGLILVIFINSSVDEIRFKMDWSANMLYLRYLGNLI
jgi:hypothetical protein